MAFYRYSTISRELLEISNEPLSPGDDEAVSEIDGVTKTDLEKREWFPMSCSFSDTPKRKLTKKEFLKKLTPNEYSTIKSAAAANALIDYYWQLFMVAEFIDLNDEDVVIGLSTLEQIGLLSPGRAMEIIS